MAYSVVLQCGISEDSKMTKSKLLKCPIYSKNLRKQFVIKTEHTMYINIDIVSKDLFSR